VAAPTKQEIDKKNKKLNRGTQDELEILRLVIMESAPIRTVVMDRLRQVKARVNGTQIAPGKNAEASAKTPKK
jgi:hypothetical protein